MSRTRRNDYRSERNNKIDRSRKKRHKTFKKPFKRQDTKKDYNCDDDWD